MSLRTRLQPWAAHSAALLLRMHHARPDNLAALLQIYGQLPSPITYLAPYSGTSSSGAPAAVAQFSTLGNPPTLPHLRNSTEPLDIGLRADFARYRDLRLSQSVNTGRSKITLWASGRVTETTLVDRFVGQGKPILTERVESSDLAPPYKFLRPHSSF